MIPIAPLLTSAVLLAAASLVARTEDRGAARRRASYGALLALLGAAGFLALDAVLVGTVATFHGLELGLLPSGLLALTNVVICVIALLAMSLAPLASHPPATLVRMLYLFAIAAAFVAVRGAGGLVALWALSALVAWSELRSRPETHATARLFARFHLPSVLLLLLGCLLFFLGSTLPAVVACLLAIAVREATLPVHGWLPTFVERAPLGIVVAFVAPQLGIYAHLLLLGEGVPQGVAHVVAGLGAATAVLAAALGTVQVDGRRALAFIVMSQTSLVAFGLENESLVARSGALVTWQVLALATSGFAMTLAALEARRGSLSLRTPSGSFARTPRMGVAVLFLGFASVGLPVTLGFVAEDLLVQGAMEEFPLLGFALIVATALNGMTVMRCFFALFSGTRQHRGERDLVPREAWVLTLVIAILIVAGAVPGRLVHLHEARAHAEEAATGLGSE